MIGFKFGSLVTLEEVDSVIRGHRQFLCLCDCGKNTVVTQNNLLKGNTTRCVSCGKEARRKSSTKFNVKEHRGAYSTWRSMLFRCKNVDTYKHVEICKEWSCELTGFLHFLKDMGDRPEGLTLDRIDNNLGYFKENCRWASRSVQNHNKRKRSDSSRSNYIGVTRSTEPTQPSWVVQFQYEGGKIAEHYNLEVDAAVAYDNHSEDYYGDRPNFTVRRTVVPNTYKSGGVTFCKKSSRFRVRITVDKKRITLGYYDTYEEAITVLNDYKSSK